MSTDREASGDGAPVGASGWTTTGAAPAGAVLAGALIIVGVLWARVDLVVVAAPIALAVLVAARGARRADPGAVTEEATASTDGATIRSTIRISAPADALVQVRIRGDGDRSFGDLVAASRARELSRIVPVLHTGPQIALEARYRLVAPDAVALADPSGEMVARTVVGPRIRRLRSLPLPRVLTGVTGGHDSVRTGEGGEFRDIHPFTPGDRLRRIDWRATARHPSPAGGLLVRRTTSLAEAAVLVVVDARDDVGERVASWSSALATEKGRSSLDIAREAAASLASGYLDAGDRVAYGDLASATPGVRLGGGSRHRARLLTTIESVTASGPPARRLRTPLAPAQSLIFVISTFLDDEAPRHARAWRAAGHRVIAVDDLPQARLDRTDPPERIAHRIVLMEREDRLRELLAGGVELLRWEDGSGPSSLEAHLRRLRRRRGTAR